MYNLESWDGFEGSNPDVLDGEDFSLELQFADGRVHVVELTLDGDGISKLNLIEKNAGGAIEAAATVE